MNAEAEYLFRHVTLRDAAYQLQLPARRARLHLQALRIIEGLCASDPGALEGHAASLAEHARRAMEGRAARKSLARIEARYLLVAAQFARRNHQLAEAVNFAQAAARHPATKAADRLTALKISANAKGHIANVKSTLEDYELLSSLAREAGDTALEADALSKIANIRVSMGTPQEAQMTIEAARNAGASSLDPRLDAFLLRVEGNIAEAEGRFEDALGLKERALARQREIEDWSQAAISMLEVARMKAMAGEFETAARHYADAQAVFSRLGDNLRLADALSGLASLRHTEKRYGEAEALYNSALETQRRYGNRRGEGIVLGNLALLLGELKQYESAEAHAELCIEACREVGNTFHEGRALGLIGYIRMNTGRVEEGLEYLAQAEQAARVSNDVRGAQICQGLRAQVGPGQNGG